MKQNIDEAWQQLTAGRSGWFWIANSLRNGDLYHVCSLAAAFKKHHGAKQKVHLVVARQSQTKVAELFRENFEEIIISTCLPINADEWDIFFQATGLVRFGRNMPLLMHPDLYEWGRSAINMAAQTHRTWMDIYKKILQLPGDCEPSFPKIRRDLEEQARAFCLEADILANRSVLFFPYAQSLPMPASDCFAQLAHDLHLEGYRVYTSIADNETPISGTVGLHIPFDLLIEISEFCGWVIAIRSGICDITSSAKCRKTYIYPSFGTLVAWSVNSMDLARDAQEISYPFTGDPRQFSALVRSPSNLSSLAAVPRRLSSYLFNTKGSDVRSLSFFESSADDLYLVCQDLLRGKFSALLIYDVPSRTHSRLQRQTRTLAAILQGFDDAFSVYACRDTLASSFFEEIGGFPLSSGCYIAAHFWHSLVIVADRDGVRMVDLLPTFARDALLMPSQTMSTNVTVRMSDYLGSAEHVDATSQARPLSLGGVQLLEGWSGLEAWGLWSEGLQPTMKLCLKHPLTSDSTLYLEAHGCVSPAFPKLSFNVLANGIVIDRVSIDAPFGNRFEVLLGRHVSGEKVVTIVFQLDEIRSPFEQGSSQDGRQLGLGLVVVELRNAQQPTIAPRSETWLDNSQRLPREAFSRQNTTLNTLIRPGLAFDNPAQSSAVENREPLQVDGLLLTDGWWDPEPWGIWGRGRLHLAEIQFDQPPTAGFGLEIAVQPLSSDGAIIIEIDTIEIGRSDCSTGDAHIISASLTDTSAADLTKRNFVLAIKSATVRSPFELSEGYVLDKRGIGVGLLWVKVVSA